MDKALVEEPSEGVLLTLICIYILGQGIADFKHPSLFIQSIVLKILLDKTLVQEPCKGVLPFLHILDKCYDYKHSSLFIQSIVL